MNLAWHPAGKRMVDDVFAASSFATICVGSDTQTGCL